MKKTLIYTAIALVVAVAFLPEGFGGVMGYYYIMSGSMEPLAPVGSLIITHPAWLRPPRIGDVIVYKSERLGLIAHRLVGVEDGEYVIKADVGGYVEKVGPGKIIGVAVLIIPLVGWVGIAASAVQSLPIVIGMLLAASLIPGRPSRVLYPLSSCLSLLPILLPLDPALIFLGPYTRYFYTALFLSGSITAWYTDLKSYAPRWVVELALTVVAIASIMVVRLPWT